MIRLNRSDAPAKLREFQERELARVRDLRATRQAPLTREELGDAYRIARPALYQVQSGKCCFCEWAEQSTGNPVEHFRPKIEADRRPGSTAREGYWWLAWSWDNLLFTCETCNGAKFKGVRFPLAEGSVALEPEQQPPGGEQPLLLDPYAEEPGEYIEFIPDQTGTWLPRPRRDRPEGHAKRGETTISVLGLARRQELMVHRQTHVDKFVMPRVEDIREAIATGNSEIVLRQWNRVMDSLFAARVPFHALSRDVLMHHIDEPTRTAWGLRFPAALELSVRVA